ncbi:MAG: glycosyltransferase family 4 protein [Cellulomonas sp.]|uniref:glycosyltransferase family 4 protein n=1 Tax=Cellulomonas sp. TaxID=40001 RepID=UPI001A02FAC9|nr:glycosyltransferase family 4 protein [Cellulomonas sp.]MBF0689114.1 glycosyltransferase family 4 protein [Cellulomonas sp.]
MKIIYVQQYFNTPDMVGGNRPYEMATRFTEAGHDVHVVTTRRDPDPGDRTVEVRRVNGFTVHLIPAAYRQTMPSWQRIRAFLTYAMRASVLARRLRGDVVFASSTPLTTAIPGMYATAFRRSPLVFEVRDLWPAIPIALGYLHNPLLRSAAVLLERLAYRRAKTIVALSPDMASEIIAQGVPPEKLVVAPNAADVGRFDVPAEAGLRFREERDWLADRPLLVYCGTLGKVNGLTYLVEIASELRELGSDAVVAIYGQGSERPATEALAETLGVHGTSVRFFDPVPKQDLPAILSAATLCTSFWIPIPVLASNSANKLFDSMAAGRPIAINHGGWQAEIIARARTGLVLPESDAPAAAREIHAWLSLPVAERQQYGERAKRIGVEEYSRDISAARVLDTLEAAVGPTFTRPEIDVAGRDT